jgi:hypothetical protein
MPQSELSDDASLTTTLGLASLARVVYHDEDYSPIVSSLASRISANAADAAALMDLSMLVQLIGDKSEGLAIQSMALEQSRIYRCVHGTGAELRVLALFTPGDFMANTPLDFLIDGSNVTVHYVYTSVGTPLPAPLPDHDVAFVGVTESDANRELLLELAEATAAWPGAVINRQARLIADMTRDRMWEIFQSARDVLAPRNARTTRAALASVASGTMPLDDLLPREQFPIIVRPVDSHAGNGLLKVGDDSALLAYLDGTDADVFYIAPFVDYRSADGRFRKYRIVLISGRPYIAHLAISDEWMVHYLNAGMHESAAKREEEAICMAQFDEDFAMRHRAPLETVARLIGLDYFAIDCAETRDGRLLLFEAGTGMIVHAMDSIDLFPYKQVQMQKIFRAFRDMLDGSRGIVG